MKLNDMIFVIENQKGTVETNFLLTLDDTIEMLKQSGEYSLKETAVIFSELGRTMTEPDWAEVYLTGNKTLSLCYCRDEKHLLSFLNRRFNEEDVCEVRFDYDRCSTSCKEKLRLYGIAEDGQRNKMVEYHYSHMEHQFKQGEIMRAEFCTDKMDRFHQNLSSGIYDEDSEMKVFPVMVSKDMESVLSVRGIDLEDAIEVATNVISMAEVHRDKQKTR